MVEKTDLVYLKSSALPAEWHISSFKAIKVERDKGTKLKPKVQVQRNGVANRPSKLAKHMSKRPG